MVQILKAEISYNRGVIIVFFSFLPVIWLLSLVHLESLFAPLESLAPSYLMFWVMFIMLQGWNSNRNKEIREFRQATLPLSRRKIAVARLMVVVLLSLSMITAYFSILKLIKPAQVIDFHTVISPFAFILAMFSIYFILRDRLLYFLRNNRIAKITREKSFMILMLSNLIAVVAGFVAFITRPKAIGTIVEFAIIHNPFSGEFSLERFFIVSVILAGLTIVTFNYRKSYLE